ncbi:zinc-dependent metalloprotease [Roseisolibacter agri]|uniref:Glutaminyl-tRNA synthetase n=1 Tax=Roseisolibacter agri TaxID=2014610 RepID=A0AA37QCB1_9BACT|nr:zinc-dependent metalloprotease [Roseisolibacter agri]GLC23655.1 glutaminyl-tRNA synthetase [Roseisolibacter agri]
MPQSPSPAARPGRRGPVALSATLAATLTALVALGACRPTPSTTPTPQRPTAGGANTPTPATPAPGTPAPGSPTPGTPSPTPGGAPAGGLPAGLAGLLGGAGGAPGEPSPRPYAMVVTPGARTTRGLLTTHQLRGRLLFEIPAAQLNRDMLVVRSLRGSQQPIGGIPGTTLAGSRLVRWERRENRILLRGANYQNVVGDTTNAIVRALDIIAYAPIIAAFNVESYGRDSAAVIDVSRLFLGGVPDLIQGVPGGAPDPSRSFIERVATFEKNVEIEASQTFASSPLGGATAANPLAALFAAPRGTEVYHFSIVRLPDVPMQPRLFDERVGFFNTTQADFGTREQRVARRTFANRWRLECSDRKEGNLCVPRRPITYYVDPATPAWLVPWVKKGIEEWKPAFAEAGFADGIVAREVPRDSIGILQGEDASVSMVRWLPSASENAVGPSTVDPRSGEILDADVQMYHNIMNVLRGIYVAQVGHLDPRAQKLPLPDSLMGRLVQNVVAHEVGHTLALRHNMKGSSMYPLDSVRSKTWTARMGHSPSIMDYARFNYVAQPEDGIALEALIPKVGPYDRFAIKWGYAPLPGAPEAQRVALEPLVRMQDTLPWLRYAGDEGLQGADPGEASEAVGDADAVRATALGLRNIRRVAKLVEGASTATPGETYADLRELYGYVVNQWATELGHVARIPGGLAKQEKVVGQPGEVWTPTSAAKQRAAVAFLNEHAFRTPAYLLDASILRKIEPTGSLDRIGSAQRRVLNVLLDNGRLQRMIENEALPEGAPVYTLGAMLGDLRRGVWSELASGAAIDPYRRRLQRTYLEVLGAKINPTAPAVPAGVPAQLVALLGAQSAPDARALLRGELVDLDRQLASAVGRTSDRTSRLHLLDARAQIDRILNPER